ncbi:MAG TPA: hypothetical protein VGE75_08180 [Acidimicrobiales bacterium]
MRLRLDRSQRVVLVAGLGLACYVLGTWLTNIDSGLTGWIGGYAPLQAGSFRLVSGGLDTWVRVVLWLHIIVLWVLAALWLLRPSRANTPANDDGG